LRVPIRFFLLYGGKFSIKRAPPSLHKFSPTVKMDPLVFSRYHVRRVHFLPSWLRSNFSRSPSPLDRRQPRLFFSPCQTFLEHALAFSPAFINPRTLHSVALYLARFLFFVFPSLASYLMANLYPLFVFRCYLYSLPLLKLSFRFPPSFLVAALRWRNRPLQRALDKFPPLLVAVR